MGRFPSEYVYAGNINANLIDVNAGCCPRFEGRFGKHVVPARGRQTLVAASGIGLPKASADYGGLVAVWPPLQLPFVAFRNHPPTTKGVAPASAEWTRVSQVPDATLYTVWANGDTIAAGGDSTVYDMLIRGDSLYVATEGDGAWVRNFTAGIWQRFGNAFGPPQATNMTLIAAGGSRLFAAGGFNGTVFFRDPGDPDWTLSLLFNDRFAPGLAALSAIWTGTRWVVGSNIGIFFSERGQSPWTLSDPGAGRPLFTVPIVLVGHDLIANFGAFSSVISLSRDDGTTWQTQEILPVPVSGLAVLGHTIYASRLDGLWRRPLTDLVSVPEGGAPSRLAFAIAGPQPVGDRVRFTFELPEGGPIAIEAFDIAGRRVGVTIRETWPAGHGEIDWATGRLAAGVYYARLTASGGRAVARLIRL